MTLFHRFFTLARADAHGVLDALEDRSLVLKQCLRDAELELAQKRARREELARRLERFGRRREQLVARSASLDEDIRLALGRDEEELARFSIRGLLATRRERERVDELSREAKEQLSRLSEELEAQERELQELRDRVEAELARERACDRSRCAEPAPEALRGAEVLDEEVELELLRRRAEDPS